MLLRQLMDEAIGTRRWQQLLKRVAALEQSQNAFTINNLPLWGSVALLAMLLVRRRK